MSRRKEVEKLLRDYPIDQVEIENIKVDIDYLTSKLERHADVALTGSVVIEDKAQIETALMDLKAQLRKKEKEMALKGVAAALSTLSPSEEDLVKLRYFKQYQVKEITAFLEVSPATLTRRLNKIMSQLEGVLFDKV